MSIRAMAQVLDFAPDHWTPSVRLVAIIIADHVNDSEGSCFPSLKLIARRSGMSQRQCQRSISQMEADGWVTRQVRFDGARQTSNLYLWTNPVEIAVRGVIGDMGEGDMGVMGRVS